MSLALSKCNISRAMHDSRLLQADVLFLFPLSFVSTHELPVTDRAMSLPLIRNENDGIVAVSHTGGLAEVLVVCHCFVIAVYATIPWRDGG